ncbi:hypothetical protein [Candidatus Uabimicrobium amorphum]|uniref:16S/18S rRNA aminocarboxypropyltransferase Tsr3 C-terminal domain-containing protein n=1 Tax=Uabimicrobium amorphum TaxID=2596890 RepID=A0A5S9F2V7_UABAM|nr:hypothetical protein [Candidatus Uabimicrobium amorphum]BBM84095.1 hypothetical protein UABAM_02451 [Candidatus Uabimicrobium amorphum]
MHKLDTIIRHEKESKKKCTIYPLKYREDLRFINANFIDNYDYEGYVLLHVDGEPLSVNDKDKPLLLVDASWRWADRIFTSEKINSLPRRSICGFVTAYPRKSNFYDDPDTGLASVEALYIASLMRGKEDLSLLDHYYWKQEFLEKNVEVIRMHRERVVE